MKLRDITLLFFKSNELDGAKEKVDEKVGLLRSKGYEIVDIGFYHTSLKAGAEPLYTVYYIVYELS